MKTEFIVEKNIKGNRKSNIELLRFILCTFVVLIHLHGIFDYALSITYSAVSVFVIISGFFLTKKEDNFKGLKFLPTVLFFWATNLLVSLIFYSITNNINSVDWVTMLLYGTTQFWFLWAMVVTYFFSPLFIIGIKHMNKWASLIIIIFVFITLQMSSAPHVYHIDTYYYGNVLILFLAFMVGVWLKIHCMSFLQNKKQVINICLPILSILIPFQIIFKIISNYNDNIIFQGLANLSTQNQSPFTIVVAICLFSLFFIWEIKENKFITHLAKMSMFIYVVHYTLKQWIDQDIIFLFNVENMLALKDLVRFSLVYSISITLAIILVPIFDLYKKLNRSIKNKITKKFQN